MALKSKSLDAVRADVPVDKVTATPGGNELVRVNLVVARSVRQEWRAEALRREISMAELVRQAVSNYIDE